MFARVEWRPEGECPEESGRIRIESGTARWWVRRSGGRGELVIDYKALANGDYTGASRSTSLGVLGLIYNSIPALNGAYSVLRVSAVGREWIDAADAILE